MIRRVLCLVMSVAVLALCGCLFSMNHPLVLPDGTLAVFLEPDGSYALFSETGVLSLLRDGTWSPVSGAVLAETGGLLDVSPDGSHLLYVDVQSSDAFGEVTSKLYRVAAVPEAIPELLMETEFSIAKAVWTKEGGILCLLFGEEDLGALERLDPDTGEREWLAGDVLSFAYRHNGETIDLLGVDQDGDLTAGYVERWNPATGRRPEAAIFVLNEATIELFLTLPHGFLWDVSADGQWLALALYDSTMREPATDQDTPDLYLIDTEWEEAKRIATGAVMPAFSPDGESLIYLAAENQDSGVAIRLDLATGESSPVAGSEGASTLFWLGPNQLGVTFEIDDDRARLVEIDLLTGEATDLVPSDVAE